MPQPFGNRRASFFVAGIFAGILAGIATAACNPPTVSTGKGGTDPARPIGGNGQGGSNGSGSSGSGSGTTISLPDAAATRDDMAPAAPSACAAEAHKAEAVPLDLMLLVDASGSMDALVGAGLPSKWTLAQGALTNFVRDPRTAGLGIGLQFFPRQTECTADADCGLSLFSRCRGRGVCVDAAGMAVGPCGVSFLGAATCATGQTCTTAGTCSNNAADCLNVGQTCPMNQGMCTAGMKYCTSSSAIAECDVANYEAASVGIAPLPGNQTPLVRALREKYPSGGTPMRVAVEGALKQLRAHLEKNPGRKGALVLASDGLPSCNPTALHGIPAIADLVGMAKVGTPSIATYVVGVFTPSEIALAQPQLDMVAMAGGTNQAFVITAASDLSMRLQEALDTIRGAALSCDFMIPPPKAGTLDFGKVNVRYTPTGGAAGELPYVKAMANCDPIRGGWYYDVDPVAGTPTRILVCPSTCQQFKKDGSAQVDLVFGCATKSID